MRRSVSATLALMLVSTTTAAERAGPRPPDSAPTLVVTLRSSAGSTVPARLSVRGTAGVRAREAGDPAGSASVVELSDENGRLLARLEAERSAPTKGALEILDPSGRRVEVEGLDSAPRPGADPDGSKSTALPTASLICLDDEGGKWTISTRGDVAIEMRGAAPPPAAAEAAAPPTVTAASRPLSFELLPGRPNPFRDATELRFALPEAGHVSIEVFDVAGRKVARVFDGRREAGVQSIEYRPRALPRGRYFARLTYSGPAGSITRTASVPIIQLR